jgi:hypothetical protein
MDVAIKEGCILSPIVDAEARAFDYLQTIILEELRLRPPAAALYPKIFNKHDVVCGMRIQPAITLLGRPGPSVQPRYLRRERRYFSA